MVKPTHGLVRHIKGNMTGGTYSRFLFQNKTKWEEGDVDYLSWILKFNEQLFLDEIFGELYVLTGKNFSVPTIYRQIRRLGYSYCKFF